MLEPGQLATFRDRGLVYLRDAFSPSDASAMVDRVWQVLETSFGVRRGEPKSWDIQMGYGFGELKRDPLFLRIGSSKVVSALDDLLGPGAWDRPSNWGQLLVTFPRTDRTWFVPTEIWHTDFGFLPTRERFGVMVFGFLSQVRSQGGGTVVLEGSHQLVQQFVAGQQAERLGKMKRVRMALMDSHPYLRDLATPGDIDARNERFLREERVHGVPLRAVELTGEPGDVALCHPWLLHAVAPNCAEVPRMMTIQRIHSGRDPRPRASR